MKKNTLGAIINLIIKVADEILEFKLSHFSYKLNRK